jgi:hypothetical protein
MMLSFVMQCARHGEMRARRKCFRPVRVHGARAHSVKYLFVGTLHPDDPYEPYRRTRDFYQAIGFAYVLEEQFPADPNNPIACYMKEIAP